MKKDADKSNDYAEVRCDYFEEEDGFWRIDAWKTDDDWEEGSVVGYIDGITGNCIITKRRAQKSALVKETIKEKQAEIRSLLTDRILLMSTSHIKKETFEMLDGSGSPEISWTNNDVYGTVIHVPEEGTEDSTDPDELLACIKFARDSGCEYIRFDSEAPVYKELDVFSWEKQEQNNKERKKFEVWYLDRNGIRRFHVFEAIAEDVDLGDVITKWADREYGVASETDGTDVWYTDHNGIKIYIMREMSTYALKCYKVQYRDEKGAICRKYVDAINKDMVITEIRIMAYEQYEVLPVTDGAEVWYFDKKGSKVTIMRDIKITEE